MPSLSASGSFAITTSASTLRAQLEGELEGGGLLRIGEGDRREAAVGLALFRHRRHGEAEVPHHALEMQGPGAVQRGIDDLGLAGHPPDEISGRRSLDLTMAT